MILYIWKWWLQYNKRGGMGLVIKKLTHPYSLTHKNYNKNGWSIFCVWVSYGFGWISKGIFPEHSYYFLIFLTFFLSISLFSLPISSYFSPWFFSKIGGGGGYLQEWGKWKASISVLGYTSASRPWQEAASIGASWYTNASIPLLPPHQSFSSFSDFCPNLHAAIKRAF